MTLQEFLELPPDEQSIEAAKALTAEPWKHRWYGLQYGPNPTWICLNCKIKPSYATDEKTIADKTPCSVPDPIKLDWNTAKRLQGECDDTYCFRIQEVYKVATGVKKGTVKPYFYSDTWAAYKAQPIHYIAACMVVAGAFKENG